MAATKVNASAVTGVFTVSVAAVPTGPRVMMLKSGVPVPALMAALVPPKVTVPDPLVKVPSF